MKEHYDNDRHQEVLVKYLRQIQLLTGIVRKSSVAVDNNLPQSPSVMAVDLDTNWFQEMRDAIQVLHNNVKILSDDTQQSLNSTLLLYQQNYPIQNLDFFQTKSSVEETNKLSNENINDMPVTSTDGTLIWKTINFNQQMSRYLVHCIMSHRIIAYGINY
jgi:hypothetical protein